jgi:hypothetical protein
VGGGGYVAGNTKRSGDWGREGHIRVHLKIDQKQFSQPTKEMTNTRPSGLRIWYTAFFSSSTVLDLAPVLQLNKIYNFRPPRKTAQHINIYYYYIAGKNSSSDVSRQGGCRKNWTMCPEKAPNKSLPEKLQTKPTASERVKPQYMTPYNLNKNKIKYTN